MRHLKTLLTVLGAVTVLVLAGNTVALATTGHAFILGKANSIRTLTSLSRTVSGPALKVTTKRSTNPPFAVNGSGKVTNLNADKIDGLDSSVLGTRGYVWTLSGDVGTTSSEHDFRLTGLPAGTYLINYEMFLSNGTISSGMTNCYLKQRASTGGLTNYAGESVTTVNGSWGTGLTGAGMVKSVGGNDTQLVCRSTSSIDWSFPSTEPLRVVAIPLNSVSNKGAPQVVARHARR